MTPFAYLIFIGGPCLVIAVILGVDSFFNRKIKRPEIEHLGAGVEADQRIKTHPMTTHTLKQER